MNIICCLTCHRFHFGKTRYNGDCQLGKVITGSQENKDLTIIFQEFMERKFPEFKGMRLVVGLFTCPKYINSELEEQKEALSHVNTNNEISSLTEAEMSVLRKLGIK